MTFIKSTTSQNYEIKKSKFISYLTPITEFDTLLKKLKDEHPKASHIIYAYRSLNEFDQIVENFSDDKEPKGCAGSPTLNVLRGEELINSALLTVRYFGGIKLGTGGMIRSYANAAKEVIKISNLLPYRKKFLITFKTSYSITSRYEHYFNSLDIRYNDRDFDSSCVTWRVYLTQKEIDQFQAFEKNLK